MKKILLLLPISILFVGCGQKVLSMNPTGYANQYEVVVEGNTGYTPMGKILLAAEEKAREKCKSLNTNYHKISVDKIYAAPFVWPRVTLKFECNNNLIPTEQKILILDKDDLEKKLNKIQDLYNKGLISKEEYDKKRNELLDNF